VWKSQQKLAKAKQELMDE
jgi:hypothetical protein